jgi:dTDP-4-amino-4,6-dideoxygalactose transaminase
VAERRWRVPSAAPSIDEADIAEVVAVLRSGWLSDGPRTAALEGDFAAYCGAETVAVSSGTAALVVAGQALGLGRGDTVLVSGFTFAASANAFLSLGCDVVPVDVDSATMNIDPAALERALAAHPFARAVVVVDLYGNTAGTAQAIAVARAAGLVAIEDAAQAHGARTDEGDRVGVRADATTFSLYATKNMSAGEGGLVTTPHPDVAAAVRQLRNHGALDQYRHERVGLNHRITEVSAALAARQLRRLDAANAARARFAAQLARWCDQAWGDDVAVPAEALAADHRHVFHQFTVRFHDPVARDAVAEQLRAAGVDARHFYPYTVRQLPGVRPQSTPVADRLRDTVLTLPVHPSLDARQRRWLREAVLSSRLPALHP